MFRCYFESKAYTKDVMVKKINIFGAIMKSGLVCKQDWGQSFWVQVTWSRAHAKRILDVISGQRNPDCRSSWPQASIVQPIFDGLGTYAHTGSVLEVPT